MQCYHLEPDFMKFTKEFIEYFNKNKFHDKVFEVLKSTIKETVIEYYNQDRFKKLNEFRKSNNAKPFEKIEDIMSVIYDISISNFHIPKNDDMGTRLTSFKKESESIVKRLKSELEDVAYMNESVDTALAENLASGMSKNNKIVFFYDDSDNKKIKNIIFNKLGGASEDKNYGLFSKKPPLFDWEKFTLELTENIEDMISKNGIYKYCYSFDNKSYFVIVYYTHIPVSKDDFEFFEKEKKSADRRSTESFSENIIRNALNTHDTLTNVKKEKSYRCPVCKKAKYTSPKLLENHVLIEHENEVPPQMPVAQFIFNLNNKKTHGSCVICKKETSWNPEINKYHRFCSEACKKKYVLEAKQRLMRVYGTDNLAKDPEHQKKMLENRKISKKYTYDDGSNINCVGSYEYDFIRYNDEVLGIGSGSIEPCNILFKYEFEGKERTYIPDFYIPSLNLIIEIKDKGDNNHPNIKIHMKEMDMEKFKAIVEANKYNFIVVAGKDYEHYTEMIDYLKSRDLNEKDNNKFLIDIPKEVYKNFKNSSEGIVGETIAAFGSGLKRSIFGPSKKEKEEENKKKELEAKKEAIYKNFEKEINFHTIFNLKHPDNKIIKCGTFNCPSGKVLMGDGTTFRDGGVLEIPKGSYHLDISCLIDDGYINSSVFRLVLNKNKIIKFKEASAGSYIDAGTCVLAEGSYRELLKDEYTENEKIRDFGNKFENYIIDQKKIVDSFKHPLLKTPIYSIATGDGTFYSEVGLDANNKPVEFYFVFGWIEDYIDLYKGKEIKSELEKLKSSEGFK